LRTTDADPATQLISKNYTTYVNEFVTAMAAGGGGPDILCMDHYPFFEYPAGIAMGGESHSQIALFVLYGESLITYTGVHESDLTAPG
jgi:hypothetical protein